MKLLKASDNTGQFLAAGGKYEPIDKLTKDDLMRLVNLTLDSEDVEFDEYSEQVIQNHAHRVIYKSVALKLADLKNRRNAFTDEAARLYLEEYDAYRQE